MCKQRLPLAIAVVTLAITCEIAANFTEKANGAECVALCGIVALAGGLAKLQSQKEAEPAEVEHVLKLNMTLADPEWRSIFVNTNKTTEVRPYPQDEFSKNTDWATKWDKWKKQAEKMMTEDTLTKRLAYHNLKAATTAALQQLRPRVYEIANEVELIQAAVVAAAPDTDMTTEAEIAKDINQAVYGGENEKTGPELNTGVFGNGGGSDRENLCTASAGEGRINTALAALACPCMKGATTGNTQGQDKVCRPNPAIASAWTQSGTAPGQPTMEEVVGLCDTKSTTSLTAHLLKERADRINNMLQRTTKGTYLGTIGGGTCSAANTQGMCVKYSAVTASSGGDTTQTIKWLGALYSIAHKLETHEKAVQRRQDAAAAIKTKADLVKTLIHVVPAKAVTQKDHQPLSQTKQQEQELEANRKDCDQHKKNKSGCEKTGKCKWEGKTETEGNCKPKDGEGQTNAGTGESTSKCTGLDTEDICEVVQGKTHPGKKSVCG
uniref:Variant surface glycoprotein 1125.4227 n=1 Tax=Trypanosoma brucei TaxID=5691 RepID=A0A1J0RAK7_9TRYP|nr:variant surface glycoprotein 1125.4227 [Trypanosoma brucei]